MASEPANTHATPHRLQIHFNWKIALGVLILFLVLMRLGFWQLDRAQQKQQILKDRDARSLNPISIKNLTLDDTNTLNHTKLNIEGSYNNDKSILISNQIFQGRPGFEVITPFNLHSSDKIVLVSRGWIPSKADIRELPGIVPIKGLQQLLGEIHVPPSNQFFLPQKIDQPPNWPLRLHHLDISVILQLFNKPVFPFVVRLDKNNPGVLERHWQITQLKPMNSISYAIQWFVMALFLIIVSFIKSSNIREIIASNKPSL